MVGATGAYRLQIEVGGVASHAGTAPERGVSAIAIAARAIADLDRSGWHGKIEREGNSGTSNVGVIHAGEATNVVTERATIRAEARSHDPAFRKRIVRENRSRLPPRRLQGDQQRRRHRSGQGGRQPGLRVVQADPGRGVRGGGPRRPWRRPATAPEYRIADGGLDANSLTARGLPTVTMGVGQRNAHTVNETLDLDDFELACRVVLRLATGTENRGRELTPHSTDQPAADRSETRFPTVCYNMQSDPPGRIIVKRIVTVIQTIIDCFVCPEKPYTTTYGRTTCSSHDFISEEEMREEFGPGYLQFYQKCLRDLYRVLNFLCALGRVDKMYLPPLLDRKRIVVGEPGTA